MAICSNNHEVTRSESLIFNVSSFTTKLGLLNPTNPRKRHFTPVGKRENAGNKLFLLFPMKDTFQVILNIKFVT